MTALHDTSGLTARHEWNHCAESHTSVANHTVFLHSIQVAYKTLSANCCASSRECLNHDDVLSLLVRSIACDPNAAAYPQEQKVTGDGVLFRNRAQAVRLSMGHMLNNSKQKHEI